MNDGWGMSAVSRGRPGLPVGVATMQCGDRAATERDAQGATAPPPRIAVLIAHGSPIIVAGLASTLERNARFEVTVLDVARTRRDGVPHRPGWHVVIGDRTLGSVGSARSGAAAGRSLRACASWATLVVVAADDPRASGAPMSDCGVDEWLSLECGEEELLATLVRLPGAHPDASSSVAAAAEARAPHGTRRVHRGGIAPRTLRGVCDYIDARLADKIELDALSKLAGLSPCHFSRAFKQSTGVPPHRYLTLRRIEAAARLVKETERPFAQISIDVGFSDQSHFTKTFSQVTGDTPRSFRKRHR